jgi:outer membrane protein TolC
MGFFVDQLVPGSDRHWTGRRGPSPSDSDRPVLTLENIQRAVKNNPEIKEAQVQVEISQAKLDEVKATNFHSSS